MPTDDGEITPRDLLAANPLESNVRFDLIDPYTRAQIRALSRKLSAYVREFKSRHGRWDVTDPDAALIEMDLCAVWLQRRFSALAWLMANDLDAWSEYVAIVRVIDRRAGGLIPSDLRLRYEQH